ncbi:brain-specific angiogenesis inhibitor 1-associated protein 2-like [Anguilla anguilla]|uniref:brain-specific angiogenesis inhibitor 1-associated protein 2-like n=1 Tax=Anguilla anguilla TaxID=7936 RepID=UPI0015A8CE87|nr:brain-specific angiogenesis inhibitor 1-associated protein 2-like [Anguilla anguilla]
MSRSDEVNKMTENIYKGILDQFNPSLKSFVTSGKLYEKALTGVMVAAKGYFNAMVKLGELASDSQGAKELGDTLFQMAEIHRQIQVELEDTLKRFHSELLSQLEHKLELDNKYLTATLKNYQSERRARTDSIEHCQSQLKKLRRKCQASRHPNKYSDREMQLVELMSQHQGELDGLVAVGFRTALTEERRRYSFLVDRHCTSTKIFISYHGKVRELLSQKLSSWQQSCSQPTRLPDRALHLFRHMAPQATGAAGIAELLRQAKLGTAQPLEQRLSVQEVQPLLNGDPNPRTQRAPPSSRSETPPAQNDAGAQTSRSLYAQANLTPQHTPRHTCTSSTRVNTSTTSSPFQTASLTPGSTASGVSHSHTAPVSATVSASQSSTGSSSSLQGSSASQNTPHSPRLSQGESLSRAQTPVAHQEGLSSSPPSHNPMLMKAAELYATSTLPLPRRPISEARLGLLGGTLPRVLPVAPPTRVEALFPHIPGGGELGGGGHGGTCLLHFLPGDTLALLISEPRDGWHYGQNERTGRRGWFPFSYTQPCPASAGQHDSSSPLLSKVNSASTGYLDKLGFPRMRQLSAETGEDRSTSPLRRSRFHSRPYSVATPDTAQPFADSSFPPPSPTRTNPFAHVHLRKAVTNDRSAPVIQ